MKTKSLFLMLILAVLLTLTSYSEDQETPGQKTNKAETKSSETSDAASLDLELVLAKYYKAIGGIDKWRNLNTMIMKGEMNSQDKTMPVTAYHTRPNKCRVEFDIKDTITAQIFNGQFGWQLNPLSGNPEPAPMTAGRTSYMKDTCDIENPLIDYKKKGHDTKLLGLEKSGGREYYKINIKYKSGNVETYYIDSETFMLSKSVGIYNMDGRVIRTTTNFMDYKDTDGYVVPYKLIIEIHGAPGKETLKINKFIFNSKIDPKIYEFPKDKIKKLKPKK